MQTPQEAGRDDRNVESNTMPSEEGMSSTSHQPETKVSPVRAILCGILWFLPVVVFYFT